jgi:hypothetical protein
VAQKKPLASEIFGFGTPVVGPAAVNKRKRVEEVGTGRSLMEEVHTSMETVTPPPPSQTDYLVHLTNTVASQQVMIANLNLDIFNMTMRFRADCDELALRHQKERETLLETIASLTEKEARVQTRAEEWSHARDVLKQGLAQLGPVTKSGPLGGKVKLEEGGGVEKDESLYTWRVVEEDNARCLDLYGFTAAQLPTLLTGMSELSAGASTRKSGRGCKPTFSEEQLFLLFLYHFTHYPTLRVMHDKFTMSSSAIQETLQKTTSTVHRPLLAWSWHEGIVVVTHYVYARYFLCVNAPQDPAMAADLHDAENGRHGLHIHCVHDNKSQKVVAYGLSSNPIVDAAWLAQYAPLVVNSPLVHDYEKRMKGKFAIFSARYRGLVKECESIVGCLLALTNIDLGYGNPIVVRECLSLDL